MLLTILHHYLAWHYTKAFNEIRHVSKNLLWFVVHFFSLPQLIRAFFAPYRRMTEERGNVFSLEDLASFVIIGLISRIIGMILRTTIILSGLFTLIILLALIIATFIFWLTAPLAIIVLIIIGFRFIFVM
jgi:hypothetical protein